MIRSLLCLCALLCGCGGSMEPVDAGDGATGDAGSNTRSHCSTDQDCVFSQGQNAFCYYNACYLQCTQFSDCASQYCGPLMVHGTNQYMMRMVCCAQEPGLAGCR